MTELELIIDLHRNSERQGPGSVQDTLTALKFINPSTNETIKIADIGCGSGGQTITLAQNTNSKIWALDIIPNFLKDLNAKSLKLRLDNRIETLESSMENLPSELEELDLIWSEGAIYNIGFENGIKKWRNHLKTGGHIAISEITWTTNNRPKEINDFWNEQYPEIDTASNKIKQLENNGYSLIGYFYLKPESWINNYYKPLESGFLDFIKRNGNTDLVKKVLKENQFEIDLYLKYKEYFSYGFYIARKN